MPRRTPPSRPTRPARPARPARPQRPPTARSKAPAPPPAPSGVALELAIAPGLADLALNELRELARRSKRPLPSTALRDDAITLHWDGEPAELHALRTVQSVARRWRFEVPRPKALLDNSIQRDLLHGLRALINAAPGPFSGLRLSAAGRESAVMQRLARALADGVGLPLDEDDGDLLVRVRSVEGVWEVLARTTPRPLSVRPWRVCDRPGGLDAALAAALVRLAGVHAGDRVANPMVGSGTFLIERALAGPAAALHGADSDASAIACSERNASAAGVLERLQLWHGDVLGGDRPGPRQRYELQFVDPPWGDAVGRHADNAALHEALLLASARQAVVGGRLVLVTHEVRLAERLLANHPAWSVQHARRVWQGGHRPLCVVLERQPGSF